MYTYLAGHVGHDGDEGAFRALTRGYQYWASGRIEEIQVNTNHPEFCHVRCTMKPSMKMGHYNVYLLRFSQLHVNVQQGMLHMFFMHTNSQVYVHFSLYAGNRQVVLMCLQFFMPFLPLLQQLFS